VAGELARRMTAPDRGQAAEAVVALAREATAHEMAFGHGLVGMDVPAPGAGRMEKRKPAG
jgi:hypothetical protein